MSSMTSQKKQDFFLAIIRLEKCRYRLLVELNRISLLYVWIEENRALHIPKSNRINSTVKAFSLRN